MPRGRKLSTDEVEGLFWLVYDGPGALEVPADDAAE